MPPHPQILISTLLVALDLIGTFVFALSGATAGIKHRLDLFGVLVLAFAAANAGGIARDLLIGAVPPVGISDWRYIAIDTTAGLIAFILAGARPGADSRIAHHWTWLSDRLSPAIGLLDAAGLALFAVAGALKALTFHLGPVAAILLGVVTGVGGGVVRDVLVSEVPTVLRAELYAVAALAGASVTVVGEQIGLPLPVVGVAGALLCFGLRVAAMRRGWRLPVARV